MKNVLLVASNLLGNATASARFASILSNNKDVKLTVLNINQQDIDNIRLPFGLSKYHAIQSFIFTRATLKKVMSKDDFDVVIVTTIQPLLGFMFKRTPSKLALWYDGMPELSARTFKGVVTASIKRFIYNRVFSKVTHLLPMSTWANSQAAQFSFPALQQTHICRIGVDGNIWANPSVTQHSRAGSNSKTKVLMCGNDAKRKGYIEFFDWCIAQKYALDMFSFVYISTENHPDIKRISAYFDFSIVNDLKYQNTALLASYYHNADVFFLPTKSDMMPNVLIEAAAASLPVITADVGAINEIVLDGHTGCLLPASNWEKFYEKLTQMHSKTLTFKADDLNKHAEDMFDQKLVQILKGIVNE